MISRRPQIQTGLRIVAAGCIMLWLLAASHCSIEHLFGEDDHHTETDASETVAHHGSSHSQEAEAVEHAHSEASHSNDSKQPSHDSHRHTGGDKSCCSTLMATAQIATPFVIAKPVLEPLNFLCRVLQARDQCLPRSKTNRSAKIKDRDWVFTPEVCLGPAFRCLAPPSLT